ncbi:MAG: hypothetical protein NPIRA02_16930 [Nitrospirales bacterium]|nr:MAG: hypothetical protein NPIRA02_16930 [Nitrospirales bacterium]
MKLTGGLQPDFAEDRWLKEARQQESLSVCTQLDHSTDLIGVIVKQSLHIRPDGPLRYP